MTPLLLLNRNNNNIAITKYRKNDTIAIAKGKKMTLLYLIMYE